MYRTDRQFRRTNEQRTAVIDDVNVAKKFVSVTDQYGTPLNITISFSDPIITIPVPGEKWLIERRDSDWYLKKKANVESYYGLSPGDVSIPATGRVYIGADEVIINDIAYLRAVSGRIAANGSVLAGSMYTCTKDATGTYTVTYKVPFDQSPALSGTKLWPGAGYVSYSANSTTISTFRVFDSAGNAVDSNFTFIAMRIV